MQAGSNFSSPGIITSFLLGCCLVFPSTCFAQVPGLDITGVRAYADGNMHLYFRTQISTACGAVVRVSGDGKETIKTVALAALMSRRALTVEVTPQKVGNYCDLVYLRLDAP